MAFLKTMFLRSIIRKLASGSCEFGKIVSIIMHTVWHFWDTHLSVWIELAVWFVYPSDRSITYRRFLLVHYIVGSWMTQHPLSDSLTSLPEPAAVYFMNEWKVMSDGLCWVHVIAMDVMTQGQVLSKPSPFTLCMTSEEEKTLTRRSMSVKDSWHIRCIIRTAWKSKMDTQSSLFYLVQNYLYRVLSIQC